MLLEIEDVHKTYRGGNGMVIALDGVSLTVDAGQFVAVQGPSGCGKTTLLLIAGGLLSPNSGRIMLGGQNPYSLQPDKRAKHRAETVGFVFQQFHLIPYLGVLDNVLAPAIAARTGNAKDRARELIAHFRLEHRMHHVPGQLSTGERQRTALARALLNRPKLLLADEPTGNLDRENAQAVLGHLTEFAAEGGGVLLITHNDEAAKHAQRIIRLNEGRIAPK